MEIEGALLKAAPRHGTKGLDAFQLQAPDPHRGCTGITVHDTKGQQFFTEEEERCSTTFVLGGMVRVKWVPISCWLVIARRGEEIRVVVGGRGPYT